MSLWQIVAILGLVLLLVVLLQLPTLPGNKGPGRAGEAHHGYYGAALFFAADWFPWQWARVVARVLAGWWWIDDMAQHCNQLRDKWNKKPVIRGDYSFWHHTQGFLTFIFRGGGT